jgi:chromate reductase
MKILAFAASNSRDSINQKLASFVARKIDNATVEILDLNDYEIPIFSMEREAELGQPLLAKKFLSKISDADAIIISFAEHNGSYTAAYKNLFDWASRINGKVYQDKSMILLSTSPGAGGAASVLKVATESAPYFGADVKASVSVPSFFDNFDLQTKSINNIDIEKQISSAVDALMSSLS